MRRGVLRTSPVVEAHVRQYVREDLESIVALSLRAWAPVFASLERRWAANCSRGCVAIGVKGSRPRFVRFSTTRPRARG